MSSLMFEVLIWAGFALVCIPIIGLPIFGFVSEWGLDTRPQHLKSFADMQRAFRRGSKTREIDRRRSSAIFAMKTFAKEGADATQRETIALMMRDAIAEVLDKSDNRTANHVWHMLDTLEAVAPAWEAEFLERVSASKLEGWVRGLAIARLTRLRGLACLAFLVALAEDSQVAHAVAAAIARLGTKAATPEVLARLREMLDGTQNGWAPSAAARALIAVGQAADPVLAANLDRFDPWTRFAIRVKGAGVSASALVDRLIAAGIVDEEHRKSIKPSMVAKMQKALDEADGFKAIDSFLQRVRAVYSFDTEWDPVPDYAELLGGLSKLGAKRLTIADVDVQLDGEASREVNCKIAGHPARFNPRFMGDWTDLAAVLGGLNAGLAAAGRADRFACLMTGDQTANVIIGRADGLADLVETLGLPLEVDANAAIAIGVAAEDHTVEMLRAEHPDMKVVRGAEF